MAEIDQAVSERADETVRRAIKALVAARGFLPEQVASSVGMTRATFYRKLSGEGSRQAFRAGEVAALAAFFGVRVADMYDGVITVRHSDEGLPRLDSNQQPAEYPAAA